jgi:hypothetical protein
MTDKERLLALLKDFGITPKEYAETAVRLAAGEGGVEGCTDFFCDFVFTPEGKFADVGVWE